LVYKVFARGSYGLESAVVLGELRIVYRPKKWSSGYCETPVLAFKTLEEARFFARANLTGMFKYEIWECEAEEVREVSVLAYYPVFLHEIISFSHGKFEPPYTMPAPDGTVACTRIKPTRKIEEVNVEKPSL